MTDKYWMYSMMPKFRGPVQSGFVGWEISHVFEKARKDIANGATWVLVLDPETGAVVYFDPRPEYLVRNVEDS